MSFIKAITTSAFAFVSWQGLSHAFASSSPYVSSLYGSHFIFLTILALVLAFVQQVLASFAALTGLRVAGGLAGLLLQVSAPLSAVVAFVYWPVRAIDVSLVLNPKFGFVLPLSLDLQLHLWPAVFQTLAAIFFPPRRWHASNLRIGSVYAVIAAGYWAWIHKCASVNGFLPYPMLDEVSTGVRAAIFAAFVVVLVGVRKILVCLQR